MARAPEPRHWRAAERLIAEHPLAWVVSRAFSASPLPLLAEHDADGNLVSLLGHCGRRNPLCADFERDPAGLVLFDGPSGSVGNELVSERNWGPTWNYAAARFHVEVELCPDETEASVQRLLARLQGPGEGWHTGELGPRYHAMLRAIVAFRAQIRAFEPAFKLGQGERADTFEEIVTRHPNRDLARWMRRFQDENCR